MPAFILPEMFLEPVNYVLLFSIGEFLQNFVYAEMNHVVMVQLFRRDHITEPEP